MRLIPVSSIVLTTSVAIFAYSPAAALETILQNDGFVDGQSVGFQSGFSAGEMGRPDCSRRVPPHGA